ncbi:MAG: hypothetical protein GF416_02935 [Candidatus Altiarchaeales archaeon]|nr:hypothetical protein [Candidatus Altiarchaeales archaeon]MBD3416075.1 hypothetical protein [Candidatus Altiarchaeales archaeon]
MPEWYDRRNLLDRNPVLTRDGKSVPLDDALPLLSEFGKGESQRYRDFDRACEEAPGATLFGRTRDGWVYAVNAPADRLSGIGVGLKSPELAAFDRKYRIIQTPEDPKTRALVGRDPFLTDTGVFDFFVVLIGQKLLEADEGRHSPLPNDRQTEDGLIRMIYSAYGDRGLNWLQEIADAGGQRSRFGHDPDLSAVASAFMCSKQLFTDQASMDALLGEYRGCREFWRGVPGVGASILPHKVFHAAYEFSHIYTSEDISREYDVMEGALSRTGIPFRRVDLALDEYWPKDIRSWSPDQSYCVECVDKRKVPVLSRASDYWISHSNVPHRISNGGGIVHGFGKTPYAITMGTIPDSEVKGYLEALKRVPGYEDTAHFRFPFGFMRVPIGGRFQDFEWQDPDMNLDTFTAADTEHGRNGLWVDPFYHRALQGHPAFKDFKEYHGDEVLILESHPDETKFHPQNTSWVAPGLKAYNHCPKSLDILRPTEGRHLVLDEPVCRIHRHGGGMGCNMGMELI